MKKPARTIYALQAIVTSYYGPTNTRGSRVTARAQAGSVTVAWDYELDTAENHVRAAQALAAKYGWTGTFTLGALPATGGYVAVRSCKTTFRVR